MAEAIVDALSRGLLTPAEVAGLGALELDALYELGAECLEAGRDHEALVVFEGLTALFPFEARFFRALAICALRRGELSAASAAFDAALLLEPERPDMWVLRAETRLCLGDVVGARADLERLQGEGDRQLTRRAEQLRSILHRPVGTIVSGESPLPSRPMVAEAADPLDRPTFTLADGTPLPVGPSPFAEEPTLTAANKQAAARRSPDDAPRDAAGEADDDLAHPTAEVTQTARIFLPPSAAERAVATTAKPLGRSPTDTALLPRVQAARALAQARGRGDNNPRRPETTAIMRRRLGLSLLDAEATRTDEGSEDETRTQEPRGAGRRGPSGGGP